MFSGIRNFFSASSSPSSCDPTPKTNDIWIDAADEVPEVVVGEATSGKPSDKECPICFDTLSRGFPNSVRLACCHASVCEECYNDLIAFGEAREAASTCPMCEKNVGADLVAAFASLSQAADAGNRDAQFELGLWYKFGKGVTPDAHVATVRLGLR